jgi:hypothetical protein
MGVARSRDKVVHAAFGSQFLLKVQEQGLVQAVQENVHAEDRREDECNLEGNQCRN